MRQALAVVALLALCVLGRAAAAQSIQTGVRFDVAAVGDSTFTFVVGPQRWVQKGQRGLAVDPRRHDVLVARFVVTAVEGNTATGLVTGATSPVTTDHVVILTRPRIPSLRQKTFWLGAGAGGLAGLLIGLAF